jgi:trehalose synthase
LLAAAVRQSAVMRLSTVSVGSLPLTMFDGVVPPGVAEAVHRAERLARREFAGRRIWNVNSTARGGGVAEMLVTLLAYARGAGVDARWAVVTGDQPFFRVTKRLHNRLHGIPGDGGPLGDDERAIYNAALAPNGSDLADLLAPGDIVILHDPQTAGLIPLVARAACSRSGAATSASTHRTGSPARHGGSSSPT